MLSAASTAAAAGSRRMPGRHQMRALSVVSSAHRQRASLPLRRRAGLSASLLQPQTQRQLQPQSQARAFFGLRDLIFGEKKEEKQQPEEAPKDGDKRGAAPKPSSNGNNKQLSSSAAQAAPAPAATAVEPILGSQDELQYSVGKYARLADGAVMASCGKTMLLTTVVSESPPGNGSNSRDFLPLMVDYRVKSYAVGLIPDTARRREFSGNDEEILQSRVVDRALRPLFPRDFYGDTQVLATVQSLDPANDPLVVAVNAASAALAVSDIPWHGPIGCVRVIELDGQLVVNPSAAQRELATLDVLYAGTEARAVMVEADGDQVSEARIVEAMELAHSHVVPLVREQQALAKKAGKPKRAYRRVVPSEELMEAAREIGLEDAMSVLSAKNATKASRQDGERHVFGKMISLLREKFAGRADIEDASIQLAAHDVFQQALRSRVLGNTQATGEAASSTGSNGNGNGNGNSNANSALRFDGRSANTVRSISLEADVLPMAHGSAVFARGDTQALCSVTLGPPDRGLKVRGPLIDSRDSDSDQTKHAMLHYEFPPYCVNETGKVGGVNRRMIGHGALAEKAITPVLPSISDFPYTVRMTSEVMSSDGSSSMATVCGVSVALMDAGVPIRAPVAGISIGLVTAGDPFDFANAIKPIASSDYRLLTDILGTEDHYGDMDFKVAGTDAGVTAVQLDVKLAGGVPIDVLARAMQFAKKARTNILRKMSGTISAPREKPKAGGEEWRVAVDFTIPTTAIGALIGQGGANVREIERAFSCTVSIDRRSGQISVAATPTNAEAAKEYILSQAADVSSSANGGSGDKFWFRKGERYTMRVAEVMDFGALLESPEAPESRRGFVHISELAPQRVENIRAVLSVGQELEFECIQDGVAGKMSIKALSGGATASSSSSGSASSTASSATTANTTGPAPHRRPSAQSLGGKRRVKAAVSTAKILGARHHPAGHRRSPAASPSRGSSGSDTSA